MVVFRSEFTDSKAMAAVHAAIRLVSPIETTIHAGQVIALLPGKTGTLNVFFNDDILHFTKSNPKKLKNFSNSFGDEFKNTKAVPVLVRTGAHFYGPGDRQFITVVYSGSGRGVFNFNADSTTHPLQKLYFTEINNQIYITNDQKDEDDKFLGYALFDIPACTSEIQTDILICREDGPSSVSTSGGPTASTSSGAVSPTPAGTTPPPTPVAELTNDQKEALAEEFLTRANKERKANGSGGMTTDNIIDNMGDDGLFDKEAGPKMVFLKKFTEKFDWDADGYDVYDSKKPDALKHISIEEYKNTIRSLRSNDYYYNQAKEYYKKGDEHIMKKKIPAQYRVDLAEKILGLDTKCIPSDLLQKDEKKGVIEQKFNTTITKCDEMRPETAVGK